RGAGRGRGGEGGEGSEEKGGGGGAPKKISPRRNHVATAQPPVHKGVGHYGPPITLDQAKKAMTAAEAKATQNNWNVAISIVDSGGHAVMLQRLDGTQLASIRIAEAKARTAVEFRRPTKALEDVIAGGGVGLRYATSI